MNALPIAPEAPMMEMLRGSIKREQELHSARAPLREKIFSSRGERSTATGNLTRILCIGDGVAAPVRSDSSPSFRSNLSISAGVVDE